MGMRIWGNSDVAIAQLRADVGAAGHSGDNHMDALCIVWLGSRPF